MAEGDHMSQCHYGPHPDQRELRPYGPGGAPICLDCMIQSPQREADAKAVFLALNEAARAISPTGQAVLGPSGPQPVI